VNLTGGLGAFHGVFAPSAFSGNSFCGFGAEVCGKSDVPEKTPATTFVVAGFVFAGHKRAAVGSHGEIRRLLGCRLALGGS
jgi:hypothetical protein